MKIRCIAAGALTALVTFAANGAETAEPDKRSALERYKGDAEGALMFCQITLRLTVSTGSKPDSADDYPTCIAKAKSASKANLDAALKTTPAPK